MDRKINWLHFLSFFTGISNNTWFKLISYEDVWRFPVNVTYDLKKKTKQSENITLDNRHFLTAVLNCLSSRIHQHLFIVNVCAFPPQSHSRLNRSLHLFSPKSISCLTKDYSVCGSDMLESSVKDTATSLIWKEVEKKHKEKHMKTPFRDEAITEGRRSSPPWVQYWLFGNIWILDKTVVTIFYCIYVRI